MDKMLKEKIAYIHGYNGSPNDVSFNILSKRLNKYYEIIGIDYDKENIDIEHIKLYLKSLGISRVIGTSLGGFMTLNLGSEFKKIVFNPCMKPSIELPKIGYKGSILEYEELENELIDNVDQDDWDSCYGFFAKNDELLGLKYKSEFDNIFKYSNFIPGGHRATKEALIQIIEEIPEFLKYINETLSKMN